MRCGECQYYSVAVDKRGRRVLRADKPFRLRVEPIIVSIETKPAPEK